MILRFNPGVEGFREEFDLSFSRYVAVAYFMAWHVLIGGDAGFGKGWSVGEDAVG